MIEKTKAYAAFTVKRVAWILKKLLLLIPMLSMFTKSISNKDSTRKMLLKLLTILHLRVKLVNKVLSNCKNFMECLTVWMPLKLKLILGQLPLRKISIVLMQRLTLMRMLDLDNNKSLNSTATQSHPQM